MNRRRGSQHCYFDTKDTAVETISISKKGATVSIQPVSLSASQQQSRSPFVAPSQSHLAHVDLKGKIH